MSRTPTTMNRIQADIIKYLQAQDLDLTTSHIAKDLGIDRHTAGKHLESLRSIGICEYREIGKSKVWKLTPSPLLSVVSHDSPLKKELDEVLGLMDERINIQNKNFDIIWTNKGEYNEKKCFELMAKSDHKCENCPVDDIFKTGQTQVTQCGGSTIVSKPVKNKRDETIAVINIVKTAEE